MEPETAPVAPARRRTIVLIAFAAATVLAAIAGLVLVNSEAASEAATLVAARAAQDAADTASDEHADELAKAIVDQAAAESAHTEAVAAHSRHESRCKWGSPFDCAVVWNANNEVNQTRNKSNGLASKVERMTGEIADVAAAADEATEARQAAFAESRDSRNLAQAMNIAIPLVTLAILSALTFVWFRGRRTPR